MGGRRFNLDSKFTPKKYVERYDIGDCLSPLPDDILIAILSTLPLKEAGRTSVLSSRWRNLWRHTSCLNFDDHGALVKIVQELELLRVGMRKYVKWVNSVLQSHRGLELKEFRICFSLVRSSKKSITKWLEFALERHVRSLELNLLHGDEIQPSHEMYVFPQEFVKSHPRTLSNYKTLEALCLKSVQVTDEAIEFLLRNCPSLERLIVHCSFKLSSLEVCGHSLVLKHLEVWDCLNLTSMKVSSPNIMSLSVTIIEVLLLGDVPMLADVYVCATSTVYMQRLVPTLLCCLSQLEILTLDVASYKDLITDLKFPEMPKLKKLVIMEFLSEEDESLLSLASFINASPRLQEFVLKQSWCRPEPQRKDRGIETVIMEFPHQHLNVVKFYGYYGCTSDVELVSYFLENCDALEEIIIDSKDQYISLCDPVDPQHLEMEQTSRTLAKQQLEPLVPKHIRLVLC